MSASLSRRLRKRERLFGAWTSLGHPSITEAFTAAPVDFIGVDLEHSTISQEQTQRLIAASQAGGVSCLVRVASHNGEQIKRVLDSGADGIIVPTVTSIKQVDQLAAWVKYPPAGARGYGVSRAQGYGMTFKDYVSAWNQRAVLIAQIESVEGVEAIDGIAAHPHLSGVMVGPYDLSGSLGVPGQLDHPRVAQAATRVIAACRKSGMACGIHIVDPDASSVRAAFRAGYTFVILASDVFILWKWAERMRRVVGAARR